MRPLLPILGLTFLACANPFATPEPDPVPVDEVVEEPPPPPAPVNPVTPVKDRMVTLATQIDGGSRKTWVHHPSRMFKGKPPLVVMLHGGREADPALFAKKVDHWFDHGVAFAFPSARDTAQRAKGKTKGKADKDDGKAKGKARRDEDEDDLAWKEENDAEYIEDVVRQLVDAESVDPKRVYVVGMGSGGELTWKLACESTLFAGFGIVSGGFSRDEAATCPMPGMPARLVVFQATGDPWLLWSGDETWTAVTEGLGMFGRRLDCAMDAPIDIVRRDLDPEDGTVVTERNWNCPDGALRLYQLDGDRRGWPIRSGGEKTSVPRDIDTMDELGSFFGFLPPK